MDRNNNRRRALAPLNVKKSHGASENETAQFCSRTGCSGRLKYTNYYPSPSPTSTSVGKASPDSKRKLPPSHIRYAHSKRSIPSDSESASWTTSLTEITSELSEVHGVERRIPAKSLKSIPKTTAYKKAGSVDQSGSSVPSGTPSSRSSYLQPSRIGQGNQKSSSTSDSLNSYSSPVSKAFGNKSKKKISADDESIVSSSRGKNVSTSSKDMQFLPSGTRVSSISRIQNKGNASSSQGTIVSSYGSKLPKKRSIGTRPRRNDGNHSSAAIPTTSTGIPINQRVVGWRSFGPSNSMPYSLQGGLRSSETITMSQTLESFRFTSMNRDLLNQFDSNRAAELLVALERIEQDEDLSPEQLLRELSLLVSSLSVYDQHQDLRLDIDNMSYEELLALEERMGTVSTALTEEELLKCLKITIYQKAPILKCEGSNGHSEDIKCSICQEEYALGDKIGELRWCCHRYHEMCISQWLRLKNWCPVCKASAVATASDPSFM